MNKQGYIVHNRNMDNTWILRCLNLGLYLAFGLGQPTQLAGSMSSAKLKGKSIIVL